MIELLLMGAKVSSANPYLRDRSLRERTVLRSVATSSAIEGIRTGFKPKTKGARTGLKTRKKV